MARRVRQMVPTMDGATRERLRALLAAVPDDAAEDHPDFIALLDFWGSCRVPWDATAPCCRTRGGVWLIESVPAVVSGIGRHVAASDGREVC